MVNPKKDYELLMRYLQGAATKRDSATLPEQTYTEDWHPTADPVPTKSTKAPVSTKRTKNFQLPVFKMPKIALPQWHSLPLWRRVRIATAVCAFAIMLFFTWKAYNFFTLTPESIYNKIYVPYESKVAGSGAVVPNSIEHYYLDGNYVAATLKAKKQKQLSDKEKMLAGLSYLQREDYSAAIKWLEPAANNFKSPYRQQAEYYLALAYLKNEDFDRCIVRMEHIAYTPSNPYHSTISRSIISDVKMLKWK